MLRLRRLAAAVRARLQVLAPSEPMPAPDPPPSGTASANDAAYGVARARIEAFVGQPVGSLALYEQALRHRSVLRGRPAGHLQSNERLEFLGDAVLGVAVAERLYAAFPERDEGFLTRLRAKLVNGVMLGRLCRGARAGRPPAALAPTWRRARAGATRRSSPTPSRPSSARSTSTAGSSRLAPSCSTSSRSTSTSGRSLSSGATSRACCSSTSRPRVSRSPPTTSSPRKARATTAASRSRCRSPSSRSGWGRARSKKQAEQKAAREALDRLHEEEAEAGVGAKH